MNVFPENGEDGNGIVAEVCRKLAISKGWFCEFGAWDGQLGSNTRLRVDNEWKGVYIEGDAKKFEDLRANPGIEEGRRVSLQQAFVSPDGANSLDSLLAWTPIPTDFALLIIDIDGNDLLCLARRNSLSTTSRHHRGRQRHSTSSPSNPFDRFSLREFSFDDPTRIIEGVRANLSHGQCILCPIRPQSRPFVRVMQLSQSGIFLPKHLAEHLSVDHPSFSDCVSAVSAEPNTYMNFGGSLQSRA